MPARCSLAPKHRWLFVANMTQIKVTGTNAGVSLIGRYRCACGAKKNGQPQ